MPLCAPRDQALLTTGGPRSSNCSATSNSAGLYTSARELLCVSLQTYLLVCVSLIARNEFRTLYSYIPVLVVVLVLLFLILSV
jgi:hypothetical protein